MSFDLTQGLGGLFPTDPSQGVDPAFAQQQRNAALLQLGLGALGASRTVNPYAGLSQAFQGAQSDYQGAMQNAYKNTLIKRQQEREDTTFQQQQQDRQKADRLDAATTASRLLSGLNSATDKNAYWNLVSKSPDVQALTKLGITLPTATGAPTGIAAPTDFGPLSQQLQAMAGVELPQENKTTVVPAGSSLVGTDSTGKITPLYTAPKDPRDQIGPVDPKDFTPQSLARYALSKNLTDLVPVDKNKDTKPTLTDVAMPDGTVQKQWVMPGATSGISVGSPTAAPTGMGAGRIQQMIGRITLAGNEAAQSAENLMRSGVDTNAGWLGILHQPTGGSATAIRNGLANAVSSEDTKSYGIMVSGVKRNLAAIEAAGNMPPGSLTAQMDQVELKPGDTQLNKLQRMAEIRQISTAGLESILTQPGLTEPQKTQIQAINARMQKAIPFTQADIQSLQQASHPRPTLTDAAGALGLGNSPVKVQSDADYANLKSGQSYIAPDGSTRVKK